MYILKCCDDSYYCGSTINLQKRVKKHQMGKGANHTKNRLPITLVYFEIFPSIYLAFQREKQIQKWRRDKKEALIKGETNILPELAIAFRDI